MTDMNDLVTRLRNWRGVHLARLHLLMEEAADEMERLSQYGDCPDPDNATNHDAAPAARAQPDTAGRDSDHVAGTGHTLTAAERATMQWYCDYCVGGEHADILRGLLDRLGRAAHATPPEGSHQDRCTLSFAEREVVQNAMHSYGEAADQDEECRRFEQTLWGLLERTK